MRRSALLLLLPVPLALAACGGGGGGGKAAPPTVTVTPTAYVRQAAKKTATAPSEHMTLAGSLGFNGQAVTLNGDGDFDNTSRSGTLHMSFAAAGMSGTIDEVLTGTTVYVKSPLFSTTLPSGKTWLRLDLQKLAAKDNVDLSALMEQDPAHSLSQILAATNAQKVGTETIDGAAATQYHGTLDFSKLPQAARMPGLTKTSVPFDVWVDDATGYVRRLKLAYSLGTTSISFSTDFSDFGETVNAQAPPASQTFDATNSSLKGLTP